MNEIPLLTAHDVELRVSQLQQTNYGVYATLLVYKDARCDMRYLDECFGPMNWKRDHQLINGNLFCTVSIYDEEKSQWISKQDVGTESNTEATKGQASDAFKRSCFCWGIGRELYDAPIIRFKLFDNEVSLGTNGKPKTYAKFHVGTMVYDRDKRCFTEFTVLDQAGNLRYSLERSETQLAAPPKTLVANTDKPNTTKTAGAATLNTMCSECGAEIKSQRVADFSIKRFHRPLCYSCQQRQAA